MAVPRSTALVGPSGPAASTFRERTEAIGSSIWRCLRRFGVPNQDLDDALQSVLLQLHERWGRLESLPIQELRNYACCVAIGVARGAARDRKRHEHSAVPLSDELAGDDDPEKGASRHQAVARLDRILAEMPMELREVFILYELEGLTGVEIASFLGLPAGTVASRLRRARADFQNAVQLSSSQSNTP